MVIGTFQLAEHTHQVQTKECTLLMPADAIGKNGSGINIDFVQHIVLADTAVASSGLSF